MTIVFNAEVVNVSTMGDGMLAIRMKPVAVPPIDEGSPEYLDMVFKTGNPSIEKLAIGKTVRVQAHGIVLPQNEEEAPEDD